MAITVGASTTATLSNSAGAFTIAVPTGAVEGTVLVASMASTTPVGTPAGWVQVEFIGPWNSRFTEVLYHVVTATPEPASYTFLTGTVASAAGGMTVFTDVDTADVVNTFSSVIADPGGTSVVLPSISPDEENCMLIGVVGGEISSFTTPAPMTEQYDVASAALNRVTDVFATEPLIDDGPTGTRTFTPSTTTAYGGIILALNLGCQPILPDTLFIPFKDRLKLLTMDFTDEGIARAQSEQFDNWKVVERWGQRFMADANAPTRCILHIPFKDHSREDQALSSTQSFDNWKAIERWAQAVFDGSCACNCQPLPDRCRLFIPYKDCLGDIDLTDPQQLARAAEQEFDSWKAVERWGNMYAAGLCNCQSTN